MTQLQELLDASAALHKHLCPRQVLGVRMGMHAGELLGLDLPQTGKRLLTIVETDGCFTDGVSVATNCWVGRRTLRIEDYGKVAATFIDTETERALRMAPHPAARQRAADYAPAAKNRWKTMLIGYQHMPVDALLTVERVALTTPVAAIVSRAGVRVNCAHCGEEIMNEREIMVDGRVLCRGCAEPRYYHPVDAARDWA